MVSPFKLSWPVGHSASMNKEDVENTKRALSSLGLFKAPWLFVARFSNEPLIQGLKAFQRQQGLSPDGVMTPDGPTHRKLNEVLSRREPSHRAGPAAHPRKKATADGSKDEEGSAKKQLAAVPIPAIVNKIAGFFGIAVMAAWAWWQSMSAEDRNKLRQQLEGNGGNDDLEEKCDRLHYEIDIPVCNGISRRRGKRAAARCFASANERYAACRRGVPIDRLPPLDVWNN